MKPPTDLRDATTVIVGLSRIMKGIRVTVTVVLRLKHQCLKLFGFNKSSLAVRGKHRLASNYPASEGRNGRERRGRGRGGNG